MQIDSVQARVILEVTPVQGQKKSPVLSPTSLVIDSPAPQTSSAQPPEPQRVTVTVDPTQQLVYRFVDPQTGDVVSQLPPEQLLEIARGIQDLLRATDQNRSASNDVSIVATLNLRG